MRKALLILAVLAMCATAYAAAPSKTAADMARVVAAKGLSGEPMDEDFSISIVGDPQVVEEGIQRLCDFVGESQQASAAYFPEETREQMRELMPPGSDMNAWKMNEFVAAQVAEYESRYGDVEAQFAFATEYLPGQPLATVLGLYIGDAVEWIAIAAEVRADGVVAVIIPQQAMLRLQGADAAALAVLREHAR